MPAGKGYGQVSLWLNKPNCFSVVGNAAINIMFLTESWQTKIALALDLGAQRKQEIGKPGVEASMFAS